MELLIEIAEAEIMASCATHDIAAIVGTPRGGFNSALVISSKGDEICRQHKLQLVATDHPWSRAGSRQYVFDLNGCPCSTIICT